MAYRVVGGVGCWWFGRDGPAAAPAARAAAPAAARAAALAAPPAPPAAAAIGSLAAPFRSALPGPPRGRERVTSGHAPGAGNALRTTRRGRGVEQKSFAPRCLWITTQQARNLAEGSPQAASQTRGKSVENYIGVTTSCCGWRRCGSLDVVPRRGAHGFRRRA